MTDVIDRVGMLDGAPDPAPGGTPTSASSSHAALVASDVRATATTISSVPGRLLVATATGASGVVHLALVPSQMVDHRALGWAFAAAGWTQIVIALSMARPVRRAWMGAAAIVNVVLLGMWALSRTAGLPWSLAGEGAQAATFVDITSTALEGAAALVALGLLVKPHAGERITRPALAAVSVVPVAMLALTTAALTTPNTPATAPRTNEVAGAPAGGGGAGAPEPANQAIPPDDKGFGLLMNGHQHARGTVALDAATQKELDAQLAETRKLVEKYPTVSTAEAAGFFRAGPFAPGLGSHYVSANYHLNSDGTMDADDLAAPVLIYDGVEPSSKLAGFMYTAYGVTGEPEGFAGPNDHWHFHTKVCIRPRPGGGIDSPLGADSDKVTKELCESVGGFLMENTGYMVHVWSVPGYESPNGVFTELNPAITCPDGTYYRTTIAVAKDRATICRQPGEPTYRGDDLATTDIEAPASPGAHADGHAAEHAGGNAEAHAHDAPQVYEPLDATSQRQLTEQMERARKATMQYPTVKDVVAAGASRVSVFTPGSGAHYMFPMGFGGVNRMTFDPDNPLMLLYAGNEDTSPVVGVMYLTFSDGAPEGFAGPNDHWHMHKGACLGYGSGAVDVLLPIDKDATKEACDEVGGRYMDITPWMIHVWTAPGWESPQGVFSHDNDLLVCTDGSNTAKDDFVNGCKGLA